VRESDERPSGAERVLFVDDAIVDQRHNLRSQLHQPRKYPGNPILRAKRPAEGWAINLYGTVLRSPADGSFRMWYQGYALTPGSREQYHALYATSRDGIFWERPNLGVIELDAMRENNLISQDMAVVNVIVDERDSDPARRYKALYFARMGQTSAARVCVSFSPDGIRWTPHADNPVLRDTGDTHTLLGWDERVGRYVAYPRPRPAARLGRIRVIGRSESDDFVHWSEPTVVLQADEHDPPGLEFYGMPVFKAADLYIGLLWAYHANLEEPFGRMAATVDVQLTASRDGIQWDRVGERRPFIPNGGPGSFDSHQIYTAAAPVAVGDELWFYYGGWDADHGASERHGSLGLAKLRRDGFVSLAPDDPAAEGWLVTTPFVCSGGRLRVNAEATGGYVAVAVLDGEGAQLPGFRRIDCALLDGDGIGQPVSWREHLTLDALRGQTIRLKLYLKDAKVYAFEFET
jgi:hypothetical protein